MAVLTRRPASADRTARRQFQATSQPVSRMQATTISDRQTERQTDGRNCCSYSTALAMRALRRAVKTG